jgi:hypothetical protein
MAHKVFICHSSTDKAVADAACAAIEAQRIPCWIAPRDILAGEEYGEAIVEALSECQIVLLIFSHDANNSPQVRREIERAVSKGKIIVPFRIEDVMPSRAMEFALSNTHWLDALTPPLEHYLLQLCDTITRLIQKHPAAETPLWTPPEPEPHKEDSAASAGPRPVGEPAPAASHPRSAGEKVLEPKFGHRRPAGWVWGILAVVVLFGVFAIGRMLFPGSRSQPASSPVTNSGPGAAPSSQEPDLTVTFAQAEAFLSQKRYVDAAPLLDQACTGGVHQACDDLGVLYKSGQGVAQNYSMAIQLFSKACNEGGAVACANLAQMYATGVGVAQNYPQAAALFSQGCNQGSAQGCSGLGALYLQGLGVPKNPVLARQFVAKGCDLGSQPACTELKQMK